ncbi:uncharacterized protein [Typha angustifolia]|uniref:uncharacterized protein isoform X2 n=1 Tax=Typha angustifolia TaxID=59011 RepID=UPI003C2D135F
MAFVKTVNKTAFLLKSIDELFTKGKKEVTDSALKELVQKKVYPLHVNEKPFNPDAVVALIHLIKSIKVEDAQVAEILNELPEFCSRDSSLIIKEIFGVTDEDADTFHVHTLSEIDDVESIKKMA